MDKRQPSRNAELGLSTRAIHHGYDPAEEHGALTPPIFMTSTYAFETAEAGSELFRASRRARAPSRSNLPTTLSPRGLVALSWRSEEATERILVDFCVICR